jgi:magnesium transporter
VIVDCAYYKDGSRQHEGPLPIDEAVRYRGRDDGFVWLGMRDPDPDELHKVAKQFDLPELAVEDAMQAHQRPKLEDYENGYFLVLHTARYLDDVEEVEFGEVHVFSGHDFVITIRHGAASDLHEARRRLEVDHTDMLEEGPAAAVWAILDKVVDDYEPVMAGLENDVEEVEVAVFRDSSDETRRVYFLRRELAEFYRAVHPLLQPLEVISVQQNDVVKRISGWAAIITVPTLIASIYGMNFQYMPELKWHYGYPATLTVMVLVGVVLHRVLRRAGWL